MESLEVILLQLVPRVGHNHHIQSALIKMWVFDKKFVIQKRLEADVY